MADDTSKDEERAREDLKPCPFCGAKPELREGFPYYLIICTAGGCAGRQMGRNEAEVTMRWNNRTARAEGEAEGRAAVEGQVAMAMDCVRDLAKMPCRTVGVEDMEPGCCGPCRARDLLSATPASIAARDAQLIQQGRGEGLREAAEIARTVQFKDGCLVAQGRETIVSAITALRTKGEG